MCGCIWCASSCGVRQRQELKSVQVDRFEVVLLEVVACRKRVLTTKDLKE
jgi:hypothetical protein